MLQTKRLILRNWREEDAESLFRYASDPRVSEMALWPTHTSVEMSREVIVHYFMPFADTFAIVLKDKNEPIGCIGLVPEGDEHYNVNESEREVGYWIGVPYWNKGMTTEALEAIICYCRDSLFLKSLLITVDAKNIASQRVAEKCGFCLICNYKNEGIDSKAYRLYL